MALVPAPQYTIDLMRYFASPAAEAAERRRLDTDVQTFLHKRPDFDAGSLVRWLGAYDAVLRSIQRHDLYVYIRAERDIDDTSDTKADGDLSAMQTIVNQRVDDVVATLGSRRLSHLLDVSASLARYRYFLNSSLARSAHSLDPGQSRAVALVEDPTVATIGASYKALRRSVLAAKAVPSGSDPNEIAFHARWAPFASHEEEFAALIIPLISMRTGVARLRGFNSAPDSEYEGQSLSSASVLRTLAAVRASDAYRHYQDVLAAEAARQLRVGQTSVRVWDLDSADAYRPPDISFVDATRLILNAEQPMGNTYAAAYSGLLDPANRRVDLCSTVQCDQTGFSVGFAGLESGLFFGGYTGTINNVRAIAHEAGHAVHRQFMSDHQSLAVYNTGPTFMFESFAIFNELLFYDHLYKTAKSDPERAYYLNRFLDDATFQIFGSAEETDLEARMYALVDSGNARTAGDLDRLALQVFEEYSPRLAAEPDVKVYWARDSLYYTDPLYDVSYLYAGMLALSYFSEFERDGPAFSKKYVALLENGFTESPTLLERDFLGIDLTDEAGMVRNASALIDRRTENLARIYANAAK